MKKIKNNLSIERIFSRDGNYFFGYYNLCPWNKSEKYFLGLKTKFIDRNPNNKDSAKIVLWDTRKKSEETLTSTSAWGWQQGCMLQWMPDKPDRNIIFNDRRDDKFVSIIYDVQQRKELRVIPFPIYSIHPSGKYALSLNFSRLHDTRLSYGYPGIKDEFQKENCPEGDGVYLINLKTGKSKLILSFKKLKNINYLASMEKGKHWVDHISFSPDGKRFCFFHRWYINKDLYHTRLLTSNIRGEDLFLFPDSGFYSHIDWRDNKTLFGYASISQKLGAMRKNESLSRVVLGKILPIYRKIVPKFIRKKVLPVSYFFLEDKTSNARKIKIHDEDGHSSFSPNKRYLITDTYPDKDDCRKLILYDFKTSEKRIIGKFYSIPEEKYLEREVKDFGNSSIRCDLHPKWDRKGEKVSIDSVHEGKRGIYSIKIF